ncbi:MAG: nitrilase-related carbon-nitrogen hydrolase [Bdellovibrionota bacterium]
MEKLDRVRVASLQYFIRPVSSFEEFEAQAVGHIATAADYKCQLLVFPEYFSVQLLSLTASTSSIRDQVRILAREAPRFVVAMSAAAKKYGLYVIAGTIPVEDAGEIKNRAYFFSPQGGVEFQDKTAHDAF